VAAGGDDYLPRADGLNGNTLVRAIVAMVQRQDLTEELAAARDGWPDSAENPPGRAVVGTQLNSERSLPAAQNGLVPQAR
jgi:hypothetical protein